MSGHQRITQLAGRSCAEIRDHRSRQIVGWLPDPAFEEIVGCLPGDGGVVWITAEKSRRIREHPDFEFARGADTPATKGADDE